MSGRMLCSDEEAEARGFVGHERTRRRAILRETIEAFADADPANAYHGLASRTSLAGGNRHRFDNDRGEYFDPIVRKDSGAGCKVD